MEPSPAFESPGAPHTDEPATVAEYKVKVHDSGAVQVGDHGVQHIHYGSAGNEIGLVIKYEREKIALDRDNRFYLDITNRTSTSKRLAIAVEGVPGTVAKVVPDKTVELAGRATDQRVLTLRCTATEPMAGSTSLQVVVTDEDTGQVRSRDQVRITVPPRPRLEGVLALPERVSSAGRYAAVVRLVNRGNTELRGTLQVLDVPDGGLDCRGTGHVHLEDGGFDLSSREPREPKEIKIEIDFPGQQWTDRTWKVLLSVDVEDHEEIGEVVISNCKITQFGLWLDLQRHLARLAQWFTEWSAQHEQIRRRWLVIGGIFVFVVGVLVGRSISPASEAPVAAPESSPGPTIELPIVTPAVIELPYTEMRCQAGTSIAFLKPLTEEDTLTHGKWLLEIESARLKSLAKSAPVLQQQGVEVHASGRTQVCSVALDEYGPSERFTAFIWAGPVPTGEAAELCVNLGKPNPYDCFLVPTK